MLNTDNMSILGLTLDYGPFGVPVTRAADVSVPAGFMEEFNAEHICNHSDPTGRYAYDQQAS